VHPVFSPSGRHVYFASPRGGGLNIWRLAVTVDGRPDGLLEQVTTGAGQDVEPAFSGGGERLAFAILRQNADLWRLPLAALTQLPTGPPERLVSTTREDSRGAFSPDGSAVAFLSTAPAAEHLAALARRRGRARPHHRPGGDFQPNWSPDGRTIAFFSSRGGSADIWSVEVATGAPRALTTGAATEANPSFSPDGSLIAYHSDAGGRQEAWMMRRDGTAARALTRSGAAGHFLRWTRDGRSVVFLAPASGGRLMTVPAEGGEPVPLVEIAGGSHISFTPDFSKVIDVLGHQVLWATAVAGAERSKLFAFDDPRDRIDYPVLSPDGRFLLFDVFRPSGGDVWLLEGL
jgi:Tol biopolymer transport system component